MMELSEYKHIEGPIKASPKMTQKRLQAHSGINGGESAEVAKQRQAVGPFLVFPV